MSAFLNPHLLWGLILLSAPIIIHLLNKRRFEVHDWAAMEFLLKADVRNRRRLQIEDLILLLLRAGVIAAAVFLVARPVLQGWGGQEESERTIVVDDSFSMEHRPAGQSALERAREVAAFEVQKAIASGARVSARRGTLPADEIGSVEGPVAAGEASGGERPSPSAESTVQSGSRLLAGIRALDAADGSLRFAEAVESEAKRLEDDRRGGLRALYLVSDFRRADWLDPKGELLPRLREAFARLRKSAGERVRLRLIQVGESRRENCAVTRVKLGAAQPIAGVPVEVTVEVMNFGAEERRGLAGELEVGDPQNPVQRIPLPVFPPIPPGGSASVAIDHAFAAPGEYPLTARIDEDKLGRDDRAYAVAVVRDALSVLIVDGDPGADRLSGESGFLAAALAPRGAAPSGIRPQVVPPGLNADMLKGRDAVILLNVADVPAADREALLAFSRSGGGVAFFLGNRVRADSYRDSFGDSGLFPATLREPVEATEGVRIDFGDLSHPALAVYRGIRDASLGRITAARYYDLAAGPEAQVVATYADGPRTPALIERPVGSGRTSIFNLTADRDWTDWPTDPSYPVVLQEWVRHLAPRRGEARSTWVGETLAFPIESALSAQPAAIDPRGARREAALEGSTARIQGIELAGLWRVDAGAGGEPSSSDRAARWFAVNRRTEESDLTPAVEADLRRAVSSLGIPVGFSDGDVAEGGDRREGDIWRWLALSAGLLLLSELGAAYWFGRRG